MANYQETSGTATKWKRCYRLNIINPAQGDKYIQYLEEEAVEIDGTILTNAVGSGILEQFDPNKVITVYNPITGEATQSTTTYMDIYVLLYSAYMNAALARDVVSVSIDGNTIISVDGQAAIE